MQTMTAMQVTRAGGDFEAVQRPLPEPAANQVRIKIEAMKSSRRQTSPWIGRVAARSGYGSWATAARTA
jgi:NADPH:quinone reductase-like Zn-dependent oxidoreductase